MRILKNIAFENKRNEGFNLTDMNKEFCLLYGGVGKTYDVCRKEKQILVRNWQN